MARHFLAPTIERGARPGKALLPGGPQGRPGPLPPAITAEDLDLLAGLARLRGDHDRAAELEAAALRASDRDRWAWELEAAARWVPADPIPELVEAERRRPTPAVSESFVSRHQERDSDAAPIVAKCGIYRFGRWEGSETRVYRAACGSRSCAECGPKVIGRKLAAIPEDRELHAIEIPRSAWPALERRLRRKRQRGEAGDYCRVPRVRTPEDRQGAPKAGDDDLLLIVTDAADVGAPITLAQVGELMLQAKSADGAITASRSWRASAKGEPPEGFVDEGRVTSTPEWLMKKATQMGLEPVRRGLLIDFGATTPEQHARLKFIGQVVTDDEYARLKKGSGPSGRELASSVRAGLRPAGAEHDDVIARLRAQGVRARKVS